MLDDIPEVITKNENILFSDNKNFKRMFIEEYNYQTVKAKRR
jgi:hypothetical protein